MNAFFSIFSQRLFLKNCAIGQTQCRFQYLDRVTYCETLIFECVAPQYHKGFFPSYPIYVTRYPTIFFPEKKILHVKI